MKRILKVFAVLLVVLTGVFGFFPKTEVWAKVQWNKNIYQDIADMVYSTHYQYKFHKGTLKNAALTGEDQASQIVMEFIDLCH